MAETRSRLEMRVVEELQQYGVRATEELLGMAIGFVKLHRPIRVEEAVHQLVNCTEDSVLY